MRKEKLWFDKGLDRVRFLIKFKALGCRSHQLGLITVYVRERSIRLGWLSSGCCLLRWCSPWLLYIWSKFSPEFTRNRFGAWTFLVALTWTELKWTAVLDWPQNFSNGISSLVTSYPWCIWVLTLEIHEWPICMSRRTQMIFLELLLSPWFKW